jgi:tetratricopeptide (TPR) repeat protein
VLRLTGRTPEAEQTLKEAISILSEVVDLDQATTWYGMELGFAHLCLARALKAAGRLGEAEEHFRKCLAIQEELLERDFGWIAPRLAATSTWLGELLQHQGHLDEAERCFRSAMALDERLLNEYPNNPNRVADALHNMTFVVHVRSSEGRGEATAKSLGRIVDCCQRLLASEDHRMLDIWRMAAAIYQRIGYKSEASDLYAEQVKILRHMLDESLGAKVTNDLQVLNRKNALAWLLATCPDKELRDPQEALDLASQLVEMSPGNHRYLNTLAAAQYGVGDYSLAIETLHRSVEVGGNAHDFLFLSMANWQLGNIDESRKWYERGTSYQGEMRLYVPELRLLQQGAAELLSREPQGSPE